MRSAPARYALAVSTVGVAFALVAVLWPALGQSPTLFFLLAVTLALRALLHHERAGQGHGARAQHRVRHRAAAQRVHRGHERARAYTASRYQLTVNLPIIVAESDARAYEIARRHALWVYHVGLRMPLQFWLPPGYTTEPSLRRVLASGVKLPSELSFEDLDEGGYLIVGSPATVRDKLRVFADELHAGIVCSGMTGGSHEKTLEMMQLFAEEVMPHFREDADVDETAGIGR